MHGDCVLSFFKRTAFQSAWDQPCWCVIPSVSVAAAPDQVWLRAEVATVIQMESIQPGFVKQTLAKLTKITAAQRQSLLCKIFLCLRFLDEVVSYTFGLLELMNHSLALLLYTEQFISGDPTKELARPAAHTFFFMYSADRIFELVHCDVMLWGFIF